MKDINLLRFIITFIFCAIFLNASNHPVAAIKLRSTNTLDVATIELRSTNTLEVTATAYNSLPNQTTAIDPDIAAWGDKLKPGMKCIAVSRDLIPLGLGHKTKVNIEGLEGTYVVLDKMNRRWTHKIDIYMGIDEAAAWEFGVKKVKITWLDE